MIHKARMIKPALLLAAVAAASWTARGWLEDSKELAVLKAQRDLAAEIRAGQAEVSKMVEVRLSELRANERVIDRGVIREIQKPIYQRVCFEPELVRLLNAAAAGNAPAEPDDPVPGATADAD